MTAAALAAPTAGAFQLTMPEVLTPLASHAATEAVPLPPELRGEIEDQVRRFLDALLTEDLQSDAFKSKLDAAFRLGREEISISANLMQGRFMDRNFVGMEDSAAFKALQDMRGHLDELNPGREGDLFQSRKLLGFIPCGNRLQAYFRRFQSASSQLHKTMQQLQAARDDMQRDVVEIEAIRTKLWDAMQKLRGAIHFAQTLDTRLYDKVQSLKATDALRAQALEQEVLFYARQNLLDMQTQQAVCVNGYLSLDVLKRTGREMITGCNRVATNGMSALAVAQTVARATGNQIQVMNMLSGVSQSIEGLIAETGRQLNNHVERTTEFASNPMIGIDKLKDMFDQTFKAMDAMDNFRTKAIEVMGQNNTMIREQIQRADNHVDRVRQQRIRESGAIIDGPVAL